MVEHHSKVSGLLAVLLAAFATMPLFQPFFFASSDGLFHLYRLMEYDAVLRDGVLYPRWAPDFFFGLGMPLFNFYAPLTYYFGEFFHLLGAGFIDSLRLLAAVAMAGAGLGAYLYARALLSPAASLLAAVVYMYAPYHIVNLYYRGDLPEYLAYTWFPFILWAMNGLLRQRRLRYFLAGSLCYGALILTHNLSAFIFSAFLVVYAAALLWREQARTGNGARGLLLNALRLSGIAVFGAALTVFFWLPALLEKSLVDFDRLLLHYDFHESFPKIAELFSTDLIHRYGVVFRTAEVYGYRLGLLQALFLLLGMVLLAVLWRRFARAVRAEGIAALLVAALSLFMIFPVSTAVWETLPLLNLTQFTWRLLAFVALPAALLSGIVAEAVPIRLRFAATAILVPLVIGSSVAGMAPIMSNLKEADVTPRGAMAFELSYGAIGTSAAAEYLPKSVTERPATSALALSAMLGEPIGPVAGRTAPGMIAETIERRADRVTYRVRAEKAGPFVANVLAFPGWQTFLDEQQVPTTVEEGSGLTTIQVPDGYHTISMRFVETELRAASDLASGLALLALLFLVGFGRLRRLWTAARWRAFGDKASSPARAKTRARPIGPPGKHTIAKIALVVALLPLWLIAKTAYDGAYGQPAKHRFPLVMNLQNQVQVEGYDISGLREEQGSALRVQTGVPFRLTIFWRPLPDGLGRSFRPTARLTNSFNQTWAYAAALESRAGDVAPSAAVASQLDLTVAPGTPPGVYDIEMGFDALESGLPLEVLRVQVAPMMPGERGARIGPVIVARSFGVMAGLGSENGPPVLAQPANFANSVELLEAQVADGEALKSGRPGALLRRDATTNSWSVRAGEVLHLDLNWRASQELAEELTVTARLVSADRARWAVRDSQPADGTYPTTFWSPGEVVRDQLNLAVPPETPPGNYELQLEVVARGGPLSLLDRNLAPAGPTLRLGAVAVAPAVLPVEPSVKLQRRVGSLLGEGIELLAFSLGRAELQPGEDLKVDLLWRAPQEVNKNLTLRLSVVDAADSPWAEVQMSPVGDLYPTKSWRAGEVLRGQYSLMLRAAAPAGDAAVVLELLDGGKVVARRPLDKVRILPRSRSFQAEAGRPMVKVFDDKIRLLGSDVAREGQKRAEPVPAVTAGETLDLTLYWQALSEMGTNYIVFAQVLNAAGRLVAQHDSAPQGGKAPTTAWIKDEVIADEHAISLPSDLPPGEYAVIAGLYDDLSGKRLPVQGGSDFVTLLKIQVR